LNTTTIKKTNFLGPLLFTIVILSLPSVVYAASETTVTNWYSTLPPVVAVIFAFITRKLLLSLGSAIALGSFLFALENSQGMVLVDTVTQAGGYLYNNITDTWNLKVLTFVVLILSMISVIIVAGGLKGIVQHLNQYIRSRRSAKMMTALCGLIVFIDDYANTMIVGSSMRSITDSYHVSREKLAFIVDATSAPVAGLAIVSTWIGFEVGLFGDVSQSLSLGKDGYSMFFDAFAFRFYCILMLIFVFINIYMGRDFGGMFAAEHRATTTGKLLADDANPQTSASFSLVKTEKNANITALTALIPFATLFIVLIFGLWFDGGGLTHFKESALTLFQLSAWHDIISHVKNSTTILLISALVGLITAIMLALLMAQVKFPFIFQAIKSGARSSLLPIMILLLAWSLKSVCDDLNTGEYLVDVLTPHLNPLWFPGLIFLVAAITAFGTGTSWGTMSILIPITIPVAYQLDGQTYGIVTMISLGAILDGAIFGDHCSPISDTTIMSSIASNCDHLHHVKTQIPYSLLVAFVALFFGYLPAAMGISPVISYVSAGFILAGFLYYFGKRNKLNLSQSKVNKST